VRVVAGAAKGRRLQAPEGRDVRPTSDRVREAVFSALMSMGGMEGAAVLDVFAGTGALGIEALSRGADQATFVDDAAAPLLAVKANLVTCGFADRAEVVKADALRWLAGAGGGRSYDLAFCDPPYSFDAWDRLFDLLDAEVLVLESDRELDPEGGWGVLRQKRYGTTVVTIAARRGLTS
jgi:16S rRNA (guanine966-N2)-methyltransferase